MKWRSWARSAGQRVRSTFSADRARLTVLITNITLAGRTGTEIVVRDLATGLLARGHRPIVYSPIISGPIAKELRALSVPVTDDIETIQGTVDIIHGHHTPAVSVAVARFPETPAIFVCHDFIAWHDVAPELPQVRRFVAVDATTWDRLTLEQAAPLDRTELILNAVDLRRLHARSALPPKPTRALLIAKGGGYAEIVSEACRERGIALEVIGASAGRLVDAPEAFMAGQHIVFASARSALEAVAAGCAVVVCDARGLAGTLTMDRLASWRSLNFGLRILREPITVENLLKEIDRYDSADATAIIDVIRHDAAGDAWLLTYLQIYREVIAEHRHHPKPTDGRSSALARHLQRWAPRVDPAWPWMQERQQLLEEIESLREERNAGRAGVRILQRGQTVYCGEGQCAPCAALWGFSHFESWGVWSDNDTAGLLLRPATTAKGAATLEFGVLGYVPRSDLPLTVKISANGLPLDEWFFADRQPTIRRLVIPAHVILSSGAVFIGFTILHPHSPAECEGSTDLRRLGLGLISIAACASDPDQACRQPAEAAK